MLTTHTSTQTTQPGDSELVFHEIMKMGSFKISHFQLGCGKRDGLQLNNDRERRSRREISHFYCCCGRNGVRRCRKAGRNTVNQGKRGEEREKGMWAEGRDWSVICSWPCLTKITFDTMVSHTHSVQSCISMAAHALKLHTAVNESWLTKKGPGLDPITHCFEGSECGSLFTHRNCSSLAFLCPSLLRSASHTLPCVTSEQPIKMLTSHTHNVISISVAAPLHASKTHYSGD